MRYFVTGSALASFAAGFPEDAGLYAAEYPHLGEAHLLAEHRRSIDEGAFETGLEALLDGLELRYLRTVNPGPSPSPSSSPGPGPAPGSAPGQV